jgi:hypothetical protein
MLTPSSLMIRSNKQLRLRDLWLKKSNLTNYLLKKENLWLLEEIPLKMKNTHLI